MLPDRVLVLKEPLRKGLVNHRYFPCRRGVVLRNRPTLHDFCAYGFEEPRHHSRPSRTRIFLSPWFRSARHSNTVVPAVAGHWRIESRRNHPHTGNLTQAVVDLPEHWLHLLGLVVTQHRIDPRNIPTLGLESEVLVFQIPQA